MLPATGCPISLISVIRLMGGRAGRTYQEWQILSHRPFDYCVSNHDTPWTGHFFKDPSALDQRRQGDEEFKVSYGVSLRPVCTV